MPCGSEPPAASDEDLAREAQRGRVEAFEELVRRYQVPLVRFLRRLGSAQDAEDLTQDTFVRAYENLHRYRPSWRFSTWLFTIARRLCLNRNRRRRPTSDTDALKSVPSTAASPSEAVADEEDRFRLWDRAAVVLTTPQMTALWLHYVEEMPLREVAGVLGRTRVAVKTMLFRARKRLLPFLDEPEGGPAGGSRRSSSSKCACPTAAEVPHD